MVICTREVCRLWIQVAKHWCMCCMQVFIAGELMFDRCTPSTMKHHLPWFTAAYLALQFITFAYMAGQYASFLGANPGISSCG